MANTPEVNGEGRLLALLQIRVNLLETNLGSWLAGDKTEDGVEKSAEKQKSRKAGKYEKGCREMNDGEGEEAHTQ